MVKIVWTDLAIEDLKTIHDYIAGESKLYASRFVEKVLSRVDQLAAFPMSGRKVPEIGKSEIRELLEGNYRIIFKVDEQALAILRVYHAARLLTDIG